MEGPLGLLMVCEAIPEKEEFGVDHATAVSLRAL